MTKIMVPAQKECSRFTVKNSDFISIVVPLDGKKEVKAIVKETKKEHPQARHVVWAYIQGDSCSILGLSDDGEPHGTAGRPVLEVLKGSGMTNILILVIRYFGGTKLGTGGLVQAYTRAAQDVLSLCRPIEKINFLFFYLSISYSEYEGVKKLLLSYGTNIEQEKFTEKIEIHGAVDERLFKEMDKSLFNFTNGVIHLIRK